MKSTLFQIALLSAASAPVLSAPLAKRAGNYAIPGATVTDGVTGQVYDAETGEPVYSVSTDPPMVADDGSVYSASTGEPIYSVSTDPPIVGDDGNVYSASTGERIYSPSINPPNLSPDDVLVQDDFTVSTGMPKFRRAVDWTGKEIPAPDMAVSTNPPNVGSEMSWSVLSIKDLDGTIYESTIPNDGEQHMLTYTVLMTSATVEGGICTLYDGSKEWELTVGAEETYIDGVQSFTTKHVACKATGLKRRQIDWSKAVETPGSSTPINIPNLAEENMSMVTYVDPKGDQWISFVSNDGEDHDFDQKLVIKSVTAYGGKCSVYDETKTWQLDELDETETVVAEWDSFTIKGVQCVAME